MFVVTLRMRNQHALHELTDAMLLWPDQQMEMVAEFASAVAEEIAVLKSRQANNKDAPCRSSAEKTPRSHRQFVRDRRVL
jgi:hypothetical protein